MPMSYQFPVSGLPSDARPYALEGDARAAFLRKVYGTVLLGLVSTSAAALWSLQSGAYVYAIQHVWLTMGLYFGVFFGANALRRRAGLNLVLLVAFTAVTGALIIAPSALWAGPTATANALLSTCVAFGGLTLYAVVSKRDFTFLRSFVFTGLLAVLAVGIGNMIFFHSSAVVGALSAVECFLFSAFILFDTSRLMRTQSLSDPIGFALAIYLDVVNLFLAILNLFGRRR